MIEEVKKFLDEFFVLEAEAFMSKKRKSLKNYLDSKVKLQDYALEDIVEEMGFPVMDEHDKQFFNEKKNPKCSPRYLFKISEYTHQKYGKVFLGFASQQNPTDCFYELLSIFFVIEQEKKLTIIRYEYYSDFLSDGAFYQWEYREGYKDLTLNVIEGPIAIERYIEPTDSCDSLENYNNDI